MDLSSWKQLIEEQQRQLSEVLSDCQNGSDELLLLASKMSPIVEELHEHLDAIMDGHNPTSANDTKETDKR